MSSLKTKKITDFMVKVEAPDQQNQTAYQQKPDKRKRALPVVVEYASLTMHGVKVMLPHGLKPYPSQQLMMVKLLQSLKINKNAMIESPTGSGKTLGLLAAACAWLSEYKVKRRVARQNCPKHTKITVASAFEKAASEAKISRTEVDDKSGINKSGKENESGYLQFLDNNEDSMHGEPFDVFGETTYDNSEYQPDPECTCSDMKKVRIYYGTRTHRQISQVVKEYRRLPYGHDKGEKQLRHTILASREQSCLNPDVRKSDDLTAACRERTAPEGIGCVYRHNLRNYELDPNKLRKKIESGGAGVWDMEDLTEALKSPEICPYFSSTRTLIKDADIIFTPFNYLLDPIIRSSSDVILKNSIVILDEAHNVEDTCRAAVSFVFKESEFGAALHNFHEKVLSMRDCSLLSALKSNASNNTAPDSSKDIEKFENSLKRMNALANRLYAFFRRLAKILDEQPASGNRLSKTWDWKEFVELLQNDDPEKNLLYEKDDPQFKQYRADFSVIASRKSKEEQGNSAATETLEEFKPASIAIVFVEKYLYFMTYFQNENNRELYKCNITLVQQPFGSSTQRQIAFRKPKPRKHAAVLNEEGFIEGKQRLTESICPGFEANLSFWCMSPSIACIEAFQDCHSLILASGTLCPIETLKTELGFNFDFEMEGTQVIPDKQIFASVISKGPSNYPFKCTYKNMQDVTFYVELLRTIRDVCKTVPKGVLVFVSSYRIINELKKYLSVEGLKADIEKYKQIFWEPNRSSELKQLLEEYTHAIESTGGDVNSKNGALLFAVFRGKVSEGIDFTDDMARSVICVGIPFPNATDEQVIQKKAFNNLHCRTSKILSGDEWYSTQAYRALNQALGRCLRHRNDWGAILLVDERFIEKANSKSPDSKKISRWVRHRLVSFKDHATFITALSKFVDERVNDEDIKPVKKELIIDLDDDDTPSPSPAAAIKTNRKFSIPSNQKSVFGK